MDQISKYELQQRLLFQKAAEKIINELDARGFTVEDMLQAVGLRDKITNIILETVRGNTNYCVATNEEPKEIGLEKLLENLREQPVSDEWEGDLPNQGPSDGEDFPPTHPLEN